MGGGALRARDSPVNLLLEKAIPSGLWALQGRGEDTVWEQQSRRNPSPPDSAVVWLPAT